jgi:5-methylthioribose kinase
MNMTVRILSERASFILKQARPWVVKYPHIPAPVERAEVEAGFYSIVSPVVGVASHMPHLLAFDPDSNLLWLEDLGETRDLTTLYQERRMPDAHCLELTEYLVQLHGIAVPESGSPLFRNRAMRALNHEHQYDLPLRPENGLNLDAITPGLSAFAEGLKADQQYCDRVNELGRIYLADGNVLLHGDFFPGSWLATGRGVVVIDPEFCFLGVREFDLGVFLAHLEFIHARFLWDAVMENYAGEVDWPLVRRFAGAEIMRRLLGVAQLPLAADLREKRAWLELSRELVCAL